MKNTTHGSAFYYSIDLPYIDSASNNVKGLVNLTIVLDASCSKCADIAQAVNFFKQQNVKFSSEKTVDYSSQEGKELISKFELREIPTLIISKDVLDYPELAQAWPQLNTSEKQGFFVLHSLVPPYRDLSMNRIAGFVDIILINDSSCKACYDVQANKRMLEQNFGVVISNETNIDVSSNLGKDLLKQYNITKVPVMLTSPDASLYAGLVQAWPQVGIVAGNGWFVMTKPEVLGSYKDLKTGKIVNQITLYAGDFEFQPKYISVKKGENVKLTFVNEGSVEHDFVIDELGVKTKRLQPSTSETIDFVANNTGMFSFYCSVEGHRQQGMEGNITIE